MKKYMLLLFILLIASINFNLFLRPLKLVTGGTGGIAIILSNLFNLRASLIILIINVLMLVLSYIVLSKKTTYGTIISTFVYPLFIRFTNFIPTLQLNILTQIVLTGIISGLTCAYIYKLGFSTGGINVISLILQKYFNIRIALTNFIINFIIILFGCIFFGLEKGLYAVLVIIINCYIINIINN